MTAYTFKRGFRIKADPQEIGEQMERIERSGPLTPSALVDANRKEGAPLHDYFEWNDTVAAERYRETQASYVIRAVEVSVSGASEPTRAFVSVTADGGGFEYMNVVAALSEAPTRDEVLGNALAELREFERKYGALAELADVLAAIRAVA